jgi:hypothetical protein
MLWGDDKAKAFLADMKDNNVKIATSNGESDSLAAAKKVRRTFLKNICVSAAGCAGALRTFAVAGAAGS